MGTLRYALAATVVLWHSGSIFGWHPFSGAASVKYFFVISGFYMTLILTGKYAGRDRLFLFWSNRMMRLWPSFLFVSALLVLVSFDELAAIYEQLALPSALLAVVANTTMIGYEFFDLLSVDGNGRFFFKMSDGDGETASQFVLVGQGWSLGLEIWFYLMAPFVVRSPRRTVIWLVLALVLFAATELWVEEGIWGFWVEESVWKYSWKYRFFPCIMVFFAIGALSFHLREFYRGHSIRKKIDPVALKVFFPLTFGFLVFPDLMSLIVAPQHHLKLLLLIALPCLPIWFEATRNIRIDRLLGELSYPIYLNHTLIILLTAPLVAEGGNESVRSILVLLISTAMAYAMYRFIEQPINGWRQRRVKSREDLPVPAAPGP